MFLNQNDVDALRMTLQKAQLDGSYTVTIPTAVCFELLDCWEDHESEVANAYEQGREEGESTSQEEIAMLHMDLAQAQDHVEELEAHLDEFSLLGRLDNHLS